MDTQYTKLKTTKWSSKYLCKLAVLDHIRECLEKDNHLKALDVPKDNELYYALDKELMDLLITLRLYFSGDTELELKRLDKFTKNLSKD